MRTVVAASRISTLSFVLLGILLLTGCGGGGSNEPEAYTKDTGPPEEGMVWNEAGQFWEFPQGGGGYDRESGGYGDGYADDDYGDGYAEDDASSDEVPDQGYADDDTDSDDGYGNDPYAATSGSADDSVDDGYGASEQGGDSYSLTRPDDLDEQRARERAQFAARNEGYESGYADSDGGYGAPAGNAGGGGSGFFAEKIEPLLRSHCYNCHGGGPRGSKGDLELHTPDAISQSGMVKAYKPDDSELYYRISMDPGDADRMPPKGKGLSTQEVALFKKWITDGANFGGDGGGRGGGGYGDGYGGSDPYANNGRGGGRDRGDSYDDDDEGYGAADREPAPPKNLAEAASVSFQRGNDLDAMNQLYAQSLLNDSPAAKSVLEQYRFLPARRRGTLAVRWGIGVTHKAKYDHERRPAPPGVNQDIRGLDDDDEAEDLYSDLPFSNETLDYYTGDIGDEILLRLQLRIEEGFYGEVLKAELAKRLSRGDDDDSYGDEYGDGGYGGGRGGRDGGYGRSGGYGGRGGGGSSGDKPDGERIAQIMPGVVMLGEASRKKLFDRAEEQGVDMLILIDCTSESNKRMGRVTSEYRVRLYDVAAQSVQLAGTNRIKNVDVQKARAKDPEDDSIIKEITKIFTVADTGAVIKDKKVRPYKLIEFPSTTESAKKSILSTAIALVKNKDVSPLAKLSELKFYQSRGLLSQAHAAAAMKKVAPQRAGKLATVSDEGELRTLLSEWLVVDEPVDDSDDDEDEEDDAPRKRSRTFR